MWIASIFLKRLKAARNLGSAAAFLLMMVMMITSAPGDRGLGRDRRLRVARGDTLSLPSRNLFLEPARGALAQLDRLRELALGDLVVDRAQGQARASA